VNFIMYKNQFVIQLSLVTDHCKMKLNISLLAICNVKNTFALLFLEILFYGAYSNNEEYALNLI